MWVRLRLLKFIEVGRGDVIVSAHCSGRRLVTYCMEFVGGMLYCLYAG